MDINIKDDGVYDIKEVNELTKIPIRNLQRIALRRNIEKVGKSYIFTGADIKELWLKTVSPPKDTAIPPKDTAIPPSGAKPNAIARATAQEVALSVADIQELDLEEIENFEFKFKRPADFYRLGKFVFVPNDKFIIQYSPAEYQRLKDEYATAESEIKLGRYKEETFKKLQTSLEEKIEFITEQMNYYMKLADRTLDMQGITLETLSTQTKDHLIQTTVTAKNTDWGKNENKKGK